MLFAVDQQQYVQGYLPIVMLTLYKSNLNTIGGGHPVLTGPGYRHQGQRGPGPGPRGGRHSLTTGWSGEGRRTGPPRITARPGRDRMTATTTATPPPEVRDERVAKVGLWRRLLVKPEFGSLIGALVVFVFFATQSSVFWHANGVANWLDPASTYGIMAVVVALLMIGGHFDLSAGVQLGTAGLVTAILTTEYNLVVWVAMLVSLVVCLGLGFLNGYLVIRTGLPSFIITLATFLMIQGLNLGLTKAITNTVSVGGIDQEPYFNGPREDLRQPDDVVRPEVLHRDPLVDRLHHRRVLRPA